MKRLVKSYIFTPGVAGAGTIQSSEFDDISRIASIVNITTNEQIYDGGATGFGGSLVDYTLTLDVDTSGMAATNQLEILMFNSTSEYKWTFAKVIASGVDTAKGTVIRTGAGMAISQASGNLVITSGTTTYSESIVRSKHAFDPNMIFRYGLTLNNRSANQTIFLELVDVVGDSLAMTINSATSVTVTKTAHGFTTSDIGKGIWIGNISVASALAQRATIASIPTADTVTLTVTGFPASGTGTCSLFGYNHHQIVYSGVSATQFGGGYNTQRDGWQTNSGSSTMTTAAAGHVITIKSPTGGIGEVFDETLVSGGTATARMNNKKDVPENTPLYFQIRVLNGSTAPTATTVTLHFFTASMFEAQKVDIANFQPAHTTNLVPIIGTVSVTSGTITATVNSATLSPMATVADVASAAIITTTTTAAFTPAAGLAYQVVIPVTAVTGTNPLMTVQVEESADGGTNWYPRFPTPFVLSTTQSGTTTGTGIYYLPILLATGNRVRYVQNITGTSPSITRSIGRNQLQHATSTGMQYQLISAASTNSTLVKAGPTLITALTGSNVNAAVRYLKMYDKATAPTVGTDPVAYTFMLPGSTTGGGSNVPLSSALYFARGCGIGLTTGATVADTGAVAANEHIINCQVS